VLEFRIRARVRVKIRARVRDSWGTKRLVSCHRLSGIIQRLTGLREEMSTPPIRSGGIWQALAFIPSPAYCPWTPCSATQSVLTPSLSCRQVTSRRPSKRHASSDSAISADSQPTGYSFPAKSRQQERQDGRPIHGDGDVSTRVADLKVRISGRDVTGTVHKSIASLRQRSLCNFHEATITTAIHLQRPSIHRRQRPRPVRGTTHFAPLSFRNPAVSSSRRQQAVQSDLR